MTMSRAATAGSVPPQTVTCPSRDPTCADYDIRLDLVGHRKSGYQGHVPQCVYYSRNRIPAPLHPEAALTGKANHIHFKADYTNPRNRNREAADTLYFGGTLTGANFNNGQMASANWTKNNESHVFPPSPDSPRNAMELEQLKERQRIQEAWQAERTRTGKVNPHHNKATQLRLQSSMSVLGLGSPCTPSRRKVMDATLTTALGDTLPNPTELMASLAHPATDPKTQETTSAVTTPRTLYAQRRLRAPDAPPYSFSIEKEQFMAETPRSKAAPQRSANRLTPLPRYPILRGPMRMTPMGLESFLTN